MNKILYVLARKYKFIYIIVDMEQKIVSGDAEIVLLPQDFKKTIANRLSDVLKDYELTDEMFFAEVKDKRLKAFPVVLWKIASKMLGEGYAFFILSKNEVGIIMTKFAFRPLDKSDIGCKVWLKFEDALHEGKVAMTDLGIAIRFRN